jgi:hypothetical protein
LKPVVPTHTTEVAGGDRASAQSVSRQNKKRCTLPCENDQAKPDRSSRLARSTLLSKILEDGPPKRRPFGSRPQTLTPEVSPNSFAHGTFSSSMQSVSVLRDFLRISSHLLLVNLVLLAFRAARSDGGHKSGRSSNRRDLACSLSRIIALRKISIN